MSRESKAIETNARIAQGELAWVEAHAEQIVDQYVKWCDDGRKGRHYEGDGRGGQELTGPELVMERTLAGGQDEIARQWGVFTAGLKAVNDAALKLRRAGENFVHDDSTAARKLAESIGAMAHRAPGEGWCDNCGRNCSGARGHDPKTRETTEDRLKGRAGKALCSPGCYEYHLRTGEMRPEELWKTKKERAAEKMTA